MLLHVSTMKSSICYKVMCTCIIDQTGNISQILRIDCDFKKHFPMSNLHCSQATRLTLVHHRNCKEEVRKITMRRDPVGENCLYFSTSCMNQNHLSVSHLLVMYIMHKHEGMYNTGKLAMVQYSYCSFFFKVFPGLPQSTAIVCPMPPLYRGVACHSAAKCKITMAKVPFEPI